MTIEAGEKGTEVLFISSVALHEPIPWYGPIVMNAKDEIRTAVTELNNGTFVKVKTKYWVRRLLGRMFFAGYMTRPQLPLLARETALP